jgi:hypothetical protein
MMLGLEFMYGQWAFYDHHPTAARILVLAGIFLLGCGWGFTGRRDFACYHWFWVLALVTVWIGYPLTTLRICIAAGVLLLGLALLVLYYQGRLPRGRSRTSIDKH